MSDESEKTNFYNLTKLGENYPLYPEIMERHKTAIDNDDEQYTDPKTGFYVFTAYYLYKRGTCCGSGYRHCPF